MLALLCFALKYKADQRKDALGASEKAACVGSVAFSWVFIYACATQGALKLGKDMRPGQGGMSPLRPIGAMGRYASMAALLQLLETPGLRFLLLQRLDTQSLLYFRATGYLIVPTSTVPTPFPGL